MAEERCRRCGRVLGADSVEGLCPECSKEETESRITPRPAHSPYAYRSLLLLSILAIVLSLYAIIESHLSLPSPPSHPEGLKELSSRLEELDSAYTFLLGRMVRLEENLSERSLPPTGRVTAPTAVKTYIVRQDGKGDFTSIRQALDAVSDNSIVQIADDGIYRDYSLIYLTKDNITLRGLPGKAPVLDNSIDTGVRPVALHTGEGWKIENLRFRGTGSSTLLFCGARTIVENCLLTDASVGISGAPRGVSNCLFKRVEEPLVLSRLDDVSIEHCTFDGAVSALRLVGRDYRSIRIVANIFNAQTALDFAQSSIERLVSDYNCFFYQNGAPVIATMKGVTYTALEKWQKTGQDENSFVSDPQMEFDGDRYHLLPSSPCRGRAPGGSDIGLTSQ